MVTAELSKDVNENCPGVMDESAGKADACDGCPNQAICASGEARQENPGKQSFDCSFM